MSGAAASNNRVEGNFVGTTITGLAALPNTVAGVQVLGGSGNVIGGSTSGQRNLISGGGNNGVSLRSGALNNLVQGNYIGVDVNGTAALPNTCVGAYIGESSNNVIEGNVLSGNLCSGVAISATQNPPHVATGNIVRNNRIGTNASGTQPIPNNTGVQLREGASANTIGGLTAGSGNVIAGNNGSGILIESAAAGNRHPGQRHRCRCGRSV